MASCKKKKKKKERKKKSLWNGGEFLAVMFLENAVHHIQVMNK
jgi:hypothetical protein